MVRAWFLAFFFLSSLAHAWTLNDVSILLPLPKSVDANPMLRPSSLGDGGALITPEAFEGVPQLDNFSNRETSLQQLRAVGFRIDPCFPGVVCRPQLRIVWQPLVHAERLGVFTVDAALHTFYDLTPSEFAAMRGEFARLGSAPVSAPLGVHPIAAREGLSGAYVTSLHKIVLRYAGARRLTRLTFMTVRGQSILWTFGGFDLTAGREPRPMKIARIDPAEQTAAQSFANASGDGSNFFRSALAPVPDGADTFVILLRDSTRIDARRDEAQLISAFQAIDRVEDPRAHSPNDVDCVSCHTAMSARLFAERSFPSLQKRARETVKPYISAFELANTSRWRAHTRNLRAFGYFDAEPAVSQRVINESAAVAESLNAGL